MSDRFPSATFSSGLVARVPSARYVVDVVEGLDLSELKRAYAGRGSEAYHFREIISHLLEPFSGLNPVHCWPIRHPRWSGLGCSLHGALPPNDLAKIPSQA